MCNNNAHICDEKVNNVCSSDPDDEEDVDEYKYTEQANMPGTKFDNKKRQTVRNLRIREDTAKVQCALSSIRHIFVINKTPFCDKYDTFL